MRILKAVLGIVGLLALLFVIGIIGGGLGVVESLTQPREQGHNHANHEHASPAEKLQAKQDRVVLNGTAGYAYCLVTDDNGRRSVDLMVPGEIAANVDGMSGVISVTCAKAHARGSLTIELVVDGEVDKERTTTAPRGVVSAEF